MSATKMQVAVEVWLEVTHMHLMVKKLAASLGEASKVSEVET
jgi:hypothetical protein